MKSLLRGIGLFSLIVCLFPACKPSVSTLPPASDLANGSTESGDTSWWKEAVVYQIYPRSFKDSDGDGIGDLKGIIEKLDYIQSLGIDMVWLNPVYASPNKDNGYDISNYQDIMKEFGSMADFDDLLKGFHEQNIRVFMDLVVNHCSNQHAWFQSASRDRNSPYYRYFHWWPAEKSKPPYRWSIFDEKGDAWEYNKATHSYYLHYFSDFQPDLNWENPALRQEIYKMMRFWLDKGVNGFRLDAIAFCSKDTTWPALPEEYDGNWPLYYASGPHLHEYMQEMNREVFSKYRIATVAEAMGDVERVMKFVDPSRKELNMAYSFEAIDFGYLPNEYKMPDPNGYDLVQWKKIHAKWTNAFADRGWGTIYLGNHDQPRMLSRWGNDSPEFRALSSKMLTTFILSMRGTPYYYFGDEIGMDNIRFDRIGDYNDIELLTNYAQVKSRGGDLNRFLECMKISSRDNGRTPMQWDGTGQAGFTTGKPWLKVNPNFTSVNVAAQELDSNSILHYFRKMVQLRKREPVLIYGDWKLVDPENPSLFAYTRELNGEKVLVVLNFKNNRATLRTELDLTTAQVWIGNYPDQTRNKELRPYEAVIWAF